MNSRLEELTKAAYERERAANKLDLRVYHLPEWPGLESELGRSFRVVVEAVLLQLGYDVEHPPLPDAAGKAIASLVCCLAHIEEHSGTVELIAGVEGALAALRGEE